MLTAHSSNNLEWPNHKQKNGITTVVKNTPASTNPMSSIEVDMLSQHSYNGPSTARNPPL